ncbi:MAG TPA: hypothetical protein V6C50_02895 [Crinalium sp.]
MPALRDSATADLAIAIHYAQRDKRMRVVAPPAANQPTSALAQLFRAQKCKKFISPMRLNDTALQRR